MPLDPTIATLIAAGARQAPVSQLTPEQARDRQPPFRADLMPYASGPSVGHVPVAGRFNVRCYWPSRLERRPLVLYFHGGGFVVGGLDTHDAIARNLCGGAQATVISVGYRLAPEHPFPAALEDAVSSLEWALAHAGEMSVDPAALFLCGDSAGATIAANAALHACQTGIPVAGQILVYPVTAHPSAGFDSYATFSSGYGLSREDMLWYWRQYLGSDAAPSDERAALLGPRPLAGVAPTFIATAEFDVLRDEGEAYAAKLRSAGVDVSSKRYLGMNHGFWARSATVRGAAELYDDIFAWMDARLGRA